MFPDKRTMTLAEGIRDLASRSLSALEASHNFYSDTVVVWRLMQQTVQAGRKFTIRTSTLGTVVDEQVLIGLAENYIREYHASFTFQHFVALFEDWFFDLLRLWLLVYPESLARKQIEFRTVLQSADKAAITLAVVDKELNELKYKRVSEWFEYLDKLVHLGAPTAEEIGRLSEMKAARDVLVHNKGLANATYEAKAGAFARFQVGEMLEIDERYHRESWQTIGNVIRDVSSSANQKLLN